jgi:hypothetical protein
MSVVLLHDAFGTLDIPPLAARLGPDPKTLTAAAQLQGGG